MSPFLWCMFIPLVRHFDVVLTDTLVDVRSSFIVSVCALFRTATCKVIDGFFVVVANSAHGVDVLIQNSVLVGSRCQALIFCRDKQAFCVYLKPRTLKPFVC